MSSGPPPNKMARLGGKMGMGIKFVKSSETLHQSQDENPAIVGDDTSTIKPLMEMPGVPHEVGFGSGAINFQGPGIPRPPRPLNPTGPAASFHFGQGNRSQPPSGFAGMPPRGGGPPSFGKPNSSGGRPPNAKPGASYGGPTISADGVPPAKPLKTCEEYFKAWKRETDPKVQKFRKLAYECTNLKSDRPNALDRLHSASNRVPIKIEFNIEHIEGFKNNNYFICHVHFEGVEVGVGEGVKRKKAKTNAYETALSKVYMPYMRVVKLDPQKSQLQASMEPFTEPPPEPAPAPLERSHVPSDPKVQEHLFHKESNRVDAGLDRRRPGHYKPIEDFIITEPLVPIIDVSDVHTLRRSADACHMLLEYEFYIKDSVARCVLKLENQVVAEVTAVSKLDARHAAATKALIYLKTICWVIKTKKAVDSDSRISKDEILFDTNDDEEESPAIHEENVGSRLLKGMGWSGGGLGKDGSGIAEPISVKSVINREGLGLDGTKKITPQVVQKLKEIVENYACSDDPQDLVFGSGFGLEERQVIHNECRRLNLKSKSRKKGKERYLCVRRKRSSEELLDHIMSFGGETARYIVVPPGEDAHHRAVVRNEKKPPEPKATSTKGKGRGRGKAAHDHVPTPGVDLVKSADIDPADAKPRSRFISMKNDPEIGWKQDTPINNMSRQGQGASLDGGSWLGPNDQFGPGNQMGFQNNGGQMFPQNMGNPNMNPSNNSQHNMGFNNMGNWMGDQNMGNQMGSRNMGNQMGSQWGSQNMGNQQGPRFMRNPMGGQSGNRGMGPQNIDNWNGPQGPRMPPQNMSSRMGPQNMGNQMGSQNMGNQMGSQNMGPPNVGNQMGHQNMGNQMGPENIGNQMGFRNMNNLMGFRNMGNQFSNSEGQQNAVDNQTGLHNMGSQAMGSEQSSQSMTNQMGLHQNKNQSGPQNKGMKNIGCPAPGNNEAEDDGSPFQTGNLGFGSQRSNSRGSQGRPSAGDWREEGNRTGFQNMGMQGGPQNNMGNQMGFQNAMGNQFSSNTSQMTSQNSSGNQRGPQNSWGNQQDSMMGPQGFMGNQMGFNDNQMNPQSNFGNQMNPQGSNQMNCQGFFGNQMGQDTQMNPQNNFGNETGPQGFMGNQFGRQGNQSTSQNNFGNQMGYRPL